MQLNDIEARARALTVEHLCVDPTKVTSDVRFIPANHWFHVATPAHLHADSLDVVELVMAMETEFGVEITDHEAEQLVTFGDLVDLVDAKLSRKAA